MRVRWEVELSWLHSLHLAVLGSRIEFARAILIIRPASIPTRAIDVLAQIVIMRSRLQLLSITRRGLGPHGSRACAGYFGRLLGAHGRLPRPFNSDFIESGRLQASIILLC